MCDPISSYIGCTITKKNIQSRKVLREGIENRYEKLFHRKNSKYENFTIRNYTTL